MSTVGTDATRLYQGIQVGKGGIILINIQNGFIEIANKNFAIKKNLTEEEFIKSSLFSDVLNKDDYGYKRYFIKPQIICNAKFVISLIFNTDGVLYMTNLGLQMNDSLPSWETWSENDEIQKKELNDKWLEKNVGKPPYTYPWGSISSSYDPRSGSSSITIVYK